MIFTAVVFFMPEMGGYFLEYNNFIPADPLKTPPHIAPVWYFTPYYSILRAVPPLFGSPVPRRDRDGPVGDDLLCAAVARRGAVKSIRYRGTLFKSYFAMFWSASCCSGTSASTPPTSGDSSATGRACSIPGSRDLGGSCLHRRLLCLLLPDALVHQGRQDQTGTGSRHFALEAGETTMKLRTFLAALALVALPPWHSPPGPRDQIRRRDC